MTEEEFETLLGFFKALANESRLKLVGLLAQGEARVGELAAAVGLTDATVSHHLGLLKGLGLVDHRTEGTARVYRLQPEVLEGLARSVLSRESRSELAQGAEPEAWREKVLRTYVDDEGTLTRIPASRKKRSVILDWLVDDFEVGVDYPESEVNALIQRHHWDCATLRRELVGAGLMSRAHGIYHRTPESERGTSPA